MKKYIDFLRERRYIAALAVVALVVTFAVISRLTIAYLGHTTDARENTVKVGYGDTEISENFEEPSELSMLNSDIQKQIFVQNKSSVPAFVRIYAEFSDSSLSERAKVKYGNTEYTWAAFKTALNYNDPTPTDSKWRYVPENATDDDVKGLGGYFYYTEALPAVNGEIVASTEKLFDSVTIDYNEYSYDEDKKKYVEVDSNIDRIQPLEMIVYSELVQTVETGDKIKDTQGSTVYGYDYNKETGDEWKTAWQSFLKVSPITYPTTNCSHST